MFEHSHGPGCRMVMGGKRRDHLATGDKVEDGDFLVFTWKPDGDSEPIQFEGCNWGPTIGRRTWNVRVYTTAGSGWWIVRKTADGSMTGEPRDPADPQWWREHPCQPAEPLIEVWECGSDEVGGSDEPQPTLF